MIIESIEEGKNVSFFRLEILMLLDSIVGIFFFFD